MGLKTSNPFIPLGFQAIIGAGNGSTHIVGDDEEHILFTCPIYSSELLTGEMVRLTIMTHYEFEAGSGGGTVATTQLGGITVQVNNLSYPTGQCSQSLIANVVDAGTNSLKNMMTVQYVTSSTNTPSTDLVQPTGGVFGTDFDLTLKLYVPPSVTNMDAYWSYYVEKLPVSI